MTSTTSLSGLANRGFRLVLVLVGAFSLVASAAAQKLRPAQVEAAFDALAAKAAQGEPVRIIVQFEVGFVPEGLQTDLQEVRQQRESIQEIQTSVVARLAAPTDVIRFRFIPALGLTVDAADLARLRADPQVVSVQEDEAVSAHDGTPVSPLFVDAARLDESTALIGAQAAWAAGFDGTGFEVAILDTGVDSSHPFLAGKVVAEACFSTTVSGGGSTAATLCPNGTSSQTGVGAGANCNSALYSDGCFHGTHVAGIAAGRNASPATPVAGVARGAGVVAVQVFSGFTAGCSNGGTCVLSYASDQLRGLEHVYGLVVTGGRRIVAANMSLGGGQSFTTCDTSALKPAIDNLLSVGVATVVSSGNDGFQNSTGEPGCISSAVTVGSTTKTDGVSGFSNVAPWMDLFAPGTAIRSSIPGGAYSNFDGTSMAAPHVAGAFAILKQRFPTETIAQLLARLQTSGVGIQAGSPVASYPRIQIDAAVLPPAQASVAATPVALSLRPGQTATRTVTVSNTAPAGSANLRVAAALGNFTPAQPRPGPTATPVPYGSLAPTGVADSRQTGATAMEPDGPALPVAPLPPTLADPTATGVRAVTDCTNGQIFDQSASTFRTSVIAGGRELGQSFTAPCTGFVNSILPIVSTVDAPNANQATTFTMRLYAGAGTGGALLASPSYNYTTPAVGPAFYLTITLPTPLKVVEGQVYTWFLDLASGRMGTHYSDANRYAGGDRYRTANGDPASAVAEPGNDMQFALEFGAPDRFARVTPPTASIPPGTSAAFTVTVSSMNLTEGTFTADLVLGTNDSARPSVAIPVTLTVGGSNVVAAPAARPTEAGWRLLAPAAAGMTVNDLAAMNLVQGVPGYYSGAGPNLYTGYTGTAFTTTGTGAVLPSGRGFWWYFYNVNITPGGPSNSTVLPTTLATTRPAVTTDVPLALHAAGDGFNLLGNPFGVSLNMSNIGSWTGASSLRSTVVQVWKANGSTYENSVTRPTISAWQGFWAEGGTAGSLTIPASARSTGGVLSRPTDAPEALIAFELASADGTLVDHSAALVLGAGREVGHDRGDAAKLAPISAAYVVLAFATGEGGALRAVESRPLEAATLPMAAASVGAGSELVLTWPRVEGLPEGWALTLRDLETGQTVDLGSESSYAFSVSPSSARAGATVDGLTEAVALGSPQASALPTRFELVVGPRGVTAVEAGAEGSFALDAPRPNPSRGVSVVGYSLSEAGPVRLSVFDLLGREVSVVASGEQAAGRHVAEVDGSRLAPGVYVVRLATGPATLVRRVVVVR